MQQLSCMTLLEMPKQYHRAGRKRQRIDYLIYLLFATQ